MKKKQIFAALGLVLALGLWLAAFFLDGRISDQLGGALFGLGGALLGICGTALIEGYIEGRMTPEERRELERGERDERNMVIRDRAALKSWYWTLYLLWGLFFLTLVLDHGFYFALVAVAVTLHCVFYLINMGRVAREM